MANTLKYTPEMLATIADYSENFRDKKYGDAIPSIAGLSRILKISRETLHRWKREREDFRDILDMMECNTERALLNGGLKNEMNSQIVKLVLAKFGYSENKQEVDHTSKGEKIQSLSPHNFVD